MDASEATARESVNFLLSEEANGADCHLHALPNNDGNYQAIKDPLGGTPIIDDHNMQSPNSSKVSKEPDTDRVMSSLQNESSVCAGSRVSSVPLMSPFQEIPFQEATAESDPTVTDDTGLPSSDSSISESHNSSTSVV